MTACQLVNFRNHFLSFFNNISHITNDISLEVTGFQKVLVGSLQTKKIKSQSLYLNNLNHTLISFDVNDDRENETDP